MPHLLLVEDDPAVLHMLRATAEYGGFTTSEAPSAAEALRCVRTEQFDAVLLDLGLPDLGGSHLIGEIRAVSGVPVIVVSGIGDERTRIEALDAGADDFMAKPFMPGELLARIRAAIRRHDPLAAEAAAEARKSAGAGLAAYRRNKTAPIQDRLISFLHSRERELVTSEDIIAAVWGRNQRRTERNVRVLVAMVRRKLKADREPFEIINEHGRGYKLVRLPGDAGV